MKTFKRISKYLVIIMLLVLLAGCNKPTDPTNPTEPTYKPSETETEPTVTIIPTEVPSEVTSFLKDNLIIYEEGQNSKSIVSNITLVTAINDYNINWNSNSAAITIDGNIGVVVQTNKLELVDLTATLSKDGVDVKSRTFNVRVLKGETIFILLDLNGGEIEGDSSFEVVVGKTLPLINDPVKSGYIFIGWALNGVAFDLETPLYESGVITAVYEQMAKITLFLEGGTLPEGMSNLLYIAKGDTLEVLSEMVPILEGYIFVGWFHLNEYFPLSTIVQEDLYLTAKYLLDEDVDPLYGSYYNNITATTGLSLTNELNALISYGLGANGSGNVNYGDVRYLLIESDEMADKPGYMWGIYDNAHIRGIWDSGNTWQREHVWPNSKLGTPDRVANSNRNQASDPHNLRAIIAATNSNRSNYHFVDSGPSVKGHTIPGDKYYPGDDHRGDVARILLYMAVRYKGILTLVETPSRQTYNADYADFGDINILLQWHIEDPVDDFERHRNQVIFEAQGNRNPFIDKPEYFHPVWDYFLEEEQARQGIQQKSINTQEQLKTNMTLYIVNNKFEDIFN